MGIVRYTVKTLNLSFGWKTKKIKEMKNKATLILLLITHLSMFRTNSQGTSEPINGNSIMVPNQEQVYLKTNTSLAFVGEYLYYTIYNLKEKSGFLSDVSKIAYLKLINENGNVVLNHKIRLVDGVGESNFFIPSSIPSGNYKLAAYTQWMLNNGKGYFFNKDLTIINPYTSNQAVFRPSNNEINAIKITERPRQASAYGKVPLQLDLDRSIYGLRDMIKLKISDVSSGDGMGNYVISVRKKDELNSIENVSIMDYQKIYPEKENTKEFILPELRGELIRGQISKQDGSESSDVVKVAASFPGEDYLFKISTTDDKGEFFINVHEDYGADNVYLQPLNMESNNYEVSLYPEMELDFEKLKFHSFKLERSMDNAIKERSIHNQIENAYYSSKPDTILLANGNKRFYGPDVTEYVLDEYTRFSTVKETFIEVVEHVWLQENGEGKTEFHVRPKDPYVDSGQLPLVIVDGILVLDHGLLLNLSASRINTIRISRNIHFYGTETFQGVVDITTFKGDYFENYYTGNLFSQKLFKPNEDKNYFRQSYKDSLRQDYRRLPDFRYQLLWLPKYDMNQKLQEIEFYSSDITGEFEVVLEGFTRSGKPVMLKKEFVVQ